MIEVNEYVRTNSGLIFKVNEITYDEEYKDYLYKESFLLVDWKENIVKHSKQLIDLIENKDILKVRIDKTIMFFGIDESTSDTKYKEIIKSIENGECELLEILTQFNQSKFSSKGVNKIWTKIKSVKIGSLNIIIVL